MTKLKKKYRNGADFSLKGSIMVQIHGQRIERFLNISAQRELPVWNIHTDDDGICIFSTTPKAWKQMKPIAKKTDVRLRIVSKAGIPFVLHRNRTRKLLVCGICFFFLLIYGLSFYIWDITFVGNHRFTDEELLEYLQSVYVACGMNKSRISCDELEAGIRNQFNDITWVSAEIRGTRLYIHIKENEVSAESYMEDQEPCDLTAKKSGIIVGTVIRSGLCQLKEGDVVEEGALLVDGTIPIIDDAGTVIKIHEIHSDGEIFARTMHTIEEHIPITEMVKVRTGRKRIGFFIDILGYPFYFMIPEYQYVQTEKSQWEYISTQRQLYLLEDFYLPIYVGKIVAYEYETYERNYRKEDVEDMASGYLQEYMEKLQEKGVQILGSDGKIEQSESGWQITGTLTVIEDIAMEVPSEILKHEEIEIQQ